MNLTRPRPFGQRRKTYFYGVAGFVLAAHVVVGGIVCVLPQALDQDAPRVAGVKMKIVDRLLTSDGIETGAVELIEMSQGESDALLSFDPVWQSLPQPFIPAGEPIGPTTSELPPLVVQFDEKEQGGEADEAKIPEPKRNVQVAASEPVSQPKTTSSSSQRTPTAQRRTATRSRPKTTEVKPAPTPPEQVIPKAVPTNRQPERTGLIDRLREWRERN